MNPYLAFILLVIILEYIVETLADRMNLRNLGPDLPAEFKDWYDPARYARSQEYLRMNTKFDLVSSTFMTILTVGFILAGGFNLVDRAARAIGSGEVLTGVVFAGILALLAQLVHIPFSIYSTFVIEEKFGFNRTTPRTFIMDMVKGWILAAAIGAPVFAGIVWFFMKTGSAAWLYCWGAVTIVQILLTFVAPVLLMPIFNKFVPLEDGELKASVESYARAQSFRMKGVFKMDGSRRSAKTNAFFTGFGRFRRIVLFDTLIAKHPVQELVTVIAHEMGHYKKGHITKMILQAIVTTGLMLGLLQLFLKNEGLFNAFSMEHLSVYASLFLFAFLYAPLSALLGILGNALSRKHEYEADEFAVQTTGNTEAMITALKRLAADNLSNLTPHPLKVVLDYSHPPILQRIAAMRHSGETSSITG